MICTINEENVITIQSEIGLSDLNFPKDKPAVAIIDEDTLLVVPAEDNLCGVICKISENTIVSATTVRIRTNAYVYRVSILVLETNKVFIVYGDTSYYLLGVIITINGNTISQVSTLTTLLNSNSSGFAISLEQLRNNFIVILHSNDTNNYYLEGMICKIDNNRIITDVNTRLSTESHSGYKIKHTLLENNKLFIIHTNGIGNQIYKMTCIVENITTLTVENDTEIYNLALDEPDISIVNLPKDKIFVAYTGTLNSVNSLYSQMINYYKTVSSLQTTSDEIFGITQNDNIEGQTVKVCTPAIIHSTEMTSGENITINDSARYKFKSFNIKGKTEQDENPTPSNVQSVDNVGNIINIRILNSNNTEQQNVTLTLPQNIELCKIGDYQDSIYKNSGKWYIYKEIGKIILTGDEDFSYIDNENNIHRFNTSSVSVLKNTLAYSNRFINKSWEMTSEGIYVHTSRDNNLNFYINSSRLSDISTTANALQSFKEWLSLNNTIVYYVLVTPTITEITDKKLISQLENLYTYEGTTYITSTDNIKPTFDVEYYKNY